jgi:hypothetical protein
MRESLYLKLLAKSNTVPNFYCSDEYLSLSGTTEMIIDGYVIWKDAGWFVCPPLDFVTGESMNVSLPWVDKVWSDFPFWVMPGLTTWEFLDYEFIYDPKNFLDLSGKRWEVFRKNVRKFPNRYQDGETIYIDVSILEKGDKKGIHQKIKLAFANWLEGKGDTEFQDDVTTLRYLLYGKNRKVLYNLNTLDILGINVWDSNYKYINFRYSFCVNIPFLSEYLRYLFYIDEEIQSQNKLVNDGGSVGNEKLRIFKMKLNPVDVREVRSWKKI